MNAKVHLEELVRALGAVVGDRHVSRKSSDLQAYARDMWPRMLIALRDQRRPEHPPDLVVWPESAEQVAAIVRIARERHVPIVPYGGGSGVCGGVVPLYGGITVDLKRMNRITRIDADNLVVDAEAGVNGERLERELAAHGLTLGHFPSSIYCSTLGGWLAARSAGQMSTLYGKIEDMVLEVSGVTGRADHVTAGRFGRCESGPDWKQLLVGSEGTLAILTSARLRVWPAPEARFLRAFEFPDVPTALEAVRRVMQRGLRPAVVRLYDELDTFIALRRDTKAKPESKGAAARTGLPSLDSPATGESEGLVDRLRGLLPGSGRAFGRDLLTRMLSRPRLINSLIDTVTQRVGRLGCLLIVGVEGHAARAEIEAKLVMREMETAHGRDLGEEPALYWLRNRYRVSYGMSKVFETGLFVDTMEVASTWERLLDLYDGVRHAIGEHAFVMAHFSHAYPEGCSIYFTFVGAAGSRAAAQRKYDAIWRAGTAAATRAGGTISHHHGVGMLKAPFMADEHRDAMSIYRALKRALDPDGILNPGKMGLDMDGEASWPTITPS